MDIRYGRKRSGIKKELNTKVNEWLDSIKDENVRQIAKDSVIVTGGAIANMLLGEKINDFDLYFRDKESTKAIAEYYVNLYNENNKEKLGTAALPSNLIVKEETIENIKGGKEDRVVIWIQSAGVAHEESEVPYQYFETRPEEETIEYAESLMKEASDDREKYRPVFISQNAISLTSKVQIIVRFYGEPDQIHDNYDFVHAKCYWDHSKQLLHLPADAMEAMLSRTLIYQGSLYPIASIFRTKKFIERGWRITAGQLLKIMWQISEVDLTDINTLREQLTGVDMAYMFQLIEALKTVDKEKMNAVYIAEVIDRIFD